ncbi:MAG: putative metal-binding motif-containing protein [Flavobacteriales bacterium]|nr:putative metal-binding motif-containing protein [Flavobacteriales bacterium]
MRLSTLLTTALLCGRLVAQVPQAFDFQGVARDASGNVLSAQPVSVRLSVHSGTAGGPIAYQETHAISTNAFGLFSVAVGQGSTTQGVFADVAWGAAAHFLHVELDASGGSNYLDMGTTQLLSVPYALHAGGVDCPTVSMLGDTLKQANGCFVIIPGLSAANGGCLDLDQDGFYDRPGCNTQVDCNDNAGFINPGAFEECATEVDEDCNGIVDDNPNEAAWYAWHPDADGDSYGNAAITINACARPPGHVLNDDDCDDSNANIFPGNGCSTFCTPAEVAWVDANFIFYKESLMSAFSTCIFEPSPESCIQFTLEGMGIPLSQECNTCGIGWVNCLQQECLTACVVSSESCEACMLSAGCTANMLLCFGLVDADGDGVPAGSDCNDNNAAIHPGAPEICDTIDNDCDGQIDEGNVCNPCPDDDADGFTTCDGDCDDSDENVNPDATEMCDGIDNNCDGQVDEDCAGTECGFFNGTFQGTCDGSEMCVNGFCVPCTDNDADGFTTCQGDCDDNNLNINPGAVEVCDGSDNDCNGTTDEGCAPEVCDGIDNDGDGLTDAADPSLILVPCENQIGVCNSVQKSSNLCVGGTWLTCATSDYTIGSPAYEATETSCDTQDNDCDGQVDEDNVCDPCSGPDVCSINGECFTSGQANPLAYRQVCDPFQSTTSWSFRPFGTVCIQGTACTFDSFCDGLGECAATVHKPAGTACDDGDPNTSNDVCNGAGTCAGTPCTDNDADGFTTCQGDCNDNNANINPGAVELCNSLDDDCDGQVDEGGVCP